MTMNTRFIVVLAYGSVSLASMQTCPATAADWTEVGTPTRPSWVAAAAERRLRLLPALPAAKNTMQSQVAGAFGSKGPGMTVGLVLDDGLFFSQGFGFRDEAKQHKPDELTVYRVGSLTKVVTAATFLTLVDSNTIALDDLATKYVPELGYIKQPGCTNPPCNVAVKLKHLSTHTSGLPNQMNPPEADEALWLTELQGTRLAFAPGSFAAYSGVGVEMEGLIIKRVSNKNFDTYMKDHLLTPLGMVNTHLHHNNVPANLLAQKYVATSPTSFTIDKNWDNPQMLIPAGNLFTNILDFSHFLQMEITGNAPPNVLKKTTITESQSVVIQATGQTPGPNCGGFNENGVLFSNCQSAASFGLGWGLNGQFVEHNGSFGSEWSSQTRLQTKKGMGATGFVSSDPSPANPAAFISNVVNGLLNAGLAGDNATSWTGKALSIGVARVLYLSGKSLQMSDLGAFTPQFVSAHQLNQTNVVAFLKAWQDKHGHCSTFRVRDVESANKITVRFHCEKSDFATVLDVQGSPVKIAWVDDTADAPGNCQANCNIQEGNCMKQAHSAPERQQCIHEKQQCVAACQ